MVADEQTVVNWYAFARYIFGRFFDRVCLQNTYKLFVRRVVRSEIYSNLSENLFIVVIICF